jgi:hypothetical protein
MIRLVPGIPSIFPFLIPPKGVRIQEEGKKEKPGWEKGLTGPARAFKIQVAPVLV